MISVLALAVTQTVQSQSSKAWARVPIHFDGAEPYPVILKMADGRWSTRFRATLKGGRFTSIEYLGPENLLLPYLRQGALAKTQHYLMDDAHPQVFEFRFCNLSPTQEFPSGNSVWRAVASERTP